MCKKPSIYILVLMKHFLKYIITNSYIQFTQDEIDSACTSPGYQLPYCYKCAFGFR